MTHNTASSTAPLSHIDFKHQQASCKTSAHRGARRTAVPTCARFVGIALVLVSVCLPFMEGRVTNPCIAHWTEADVNNDFKCPSSISSWLSWSEKDGIVYTLIPAIMGILLLVIGLPATLLSRYCFGCCGSNKMRPGYPCCGGKELDARKDEEKFCLYDRRGVVATKVSTVILTLLSIISIIIMYYGAKGAVKGLKEVVPSARGVLDSLEEIKTNAVGDATPTGSGATYTVPSSEIDDVIKSARDALDSVDKWTESFRNTVDSRTLIAALVSIIPCLVVATLVIGALFNVRYALPLVILILCFILQMLWFMLGSASLVVEEGFQTVCDEADAVETNEKSILAWYGIPLCTNLVQDARTQLQSAPGSAAGVFCQYINGQCSQQSFATCPSSASQCTSKDQATTLFTTVVLTDSSQCSSGCTIENCAKNCAGNARTTALEMQAQYERLTKLVTAINNLYQWTDCKYAAKEVSKRILPSICKTSSKGLRDLAGGSFLMSIVLTLTIVVALFGQKRFIPKPTVRPMERLFGVDSFLCPANKDDPVEANSSPPVFDARQSLCDPPRPSAASPSGPPTKQAPPPPAPDFISIPKGPAQPKKSAPPPPKRAPPPPEISVPVEVDNNNELGRMESSRSSSELSLI